MYLFSLSQVARRLGVRPKDISDLYCQQKLRDDLCPIVADRRLIPPEYVEVIAMELRRKGIDVGPVSQATKRGAK